MAKPKSGYTKLRKLKWQLKKHFDNPKLRAKIEVKIRSLNKA